MGYKVSKRMSIYRGGLRKHL